MEAVRTSQMSAIFNLTAWRYIPEGSKLQTHRRENLKFHNFKEDNFCEKNIRKL
jgi:hypothetical protein